MSAESSAADNEKSDVILEKVRAKCLSRGFSSLRCFSTVFRQFDKDYNREINYQEFQVGLQKYEIPMTEDESKTLFTNFDKDKSGMIDFKEFYDKLAPPLEGKRLEIVKEVFDELDTTGDGSLQTADIMDQFEHRAKRHPKYISGEWTVEEVVGNLLKAFDPSGIKSGKVTLQQFIDYYSAVSSCVQEDAYFETHLKSCWGLE